MNHLERARRAAAHYLPHAGVLAALWSLYATCTHTWPQQPLIITSLAADNNPASPLVMLPLLLVVLYLGVLHRAAFCHRCQRGTRTAPPLLVAATHHRRPAVAAGYAVLMVCAFLIPATGPALALWGAVLLAWAAMACVHRHVAPACPQCCQVPLGQAMAWWWRGAAQFAAAHQDPGCQPELLCQTDDCGQTFPLDATTADRYYRHHLDPHHRGGGYLGMALRCTAHPDG